MKSGSDTGEPQRNEERTLTKKRSMLFKLLRRKSEERTKFTAESDATYKFAGESTPEFHEARSISFPEAQDSLESHMVPDLNSSITNATANHEFVVADEPREREFVTKESTGTIEDYASVQHFKRTVHIPIITTHDPNAVCIDDTLEPIQAVVTEYSQQLNDAFLLEQDEDVEEQEASFEHIVTRRQKLKRALKLKFKNKSNPLVLN